jgi:signal transduction histidine kinase/CheY-like chemotaxis protein
MATILVVDDEPTNRQLLCTVLGYRGHRVVEAGDGEEGLQKSRSEALDLAIVDILMPTMDGFEFVRQLRSDPAIARIPIIFYTAAYYEREIRSLAQDCGVSQILTKPTEAEVIIETVDAALGHPGEQPVLPITRDFDREHLRLMTDKLSQKIGELEAVGLRLTKLIDLGRELASEHDIGRLTRQSCLSAREIVGAAQAGLGIVDENGMVRHFEFHGATPALAAALATPAVDRGIIKKLLTERAPVNLCNPSGDPEILGFPQHSPPIHSFLGVPIFSSDRTYGWLGLRNKLGASQFTGDDEKLVISLAAQTAVAYENIQRYAAIQRQADELEQKVKERTADLQRSNAELEQFAYVASHDLQEPLRKITGFTELLAQTLKENLDGDAKDYMSFITDAARRMRDLIQDLLVYSRAGKERKIPQTVHGGVVLDRVLLDLQPLIEESGAVVARGPMPTIQADEVQLAQLFQNLIGNAIKYRSTQAPRIQISAKLQSSQADLNGHETSQSSKPPTAWLFSVRDNGIGIDPKYAERIFGIFQRLHTRAQYPGTGIGLAICKKIVEGHGGHIWVESAAGQGATFNFTVPTQNSDANEDRLLGDKL